MHAFEDYRVRVVACVPDLDVRLVECFHKAPGCWKLVERFADYRIRLVESNPDFTVRIRSGSTGAITMPGELAGLDRRSE